MRKVQTFIFALMTGVLLSSKVFALFPDLTPYSPAPQASPIPIAPTIAKAQGYLEQAKSMKDKYMAYLDVGKLKQQFMAYTSQFAGQALGGLLKKGSKREKFLSYARSIKDSSVANLSNETDVQKAFVKLFFEYPSDKPSVKAEYENMGKQFQMDSAVEAVISAKAMKSELEKMREDLVKVEDCLMQGKNCSEMGMQECTPPEGGGGNEGEEEDNSCLWNNANTAALLYDKIMRYNENLVFMMSQYKAVQSIGKNAQIRKYKKKKGGKKGAWKNINLVPEQKIYVKMSSSVAFADQTADDEDESPSSQFEHDADVNTGFTTGLDGKEAELDAMDKLASLQSDVDAAKSMHNLRQLLPEYRRIFKSYHDAEAYYNQARNNFFTSSLCAIKMLDGKYKDGATAWLGRNCTTGSGGRIYCHYEHEGLTPQEAGGSRSYEVDCPDDKSKKCYVATFEYLNENRGISGYLLNLFSTAKETATTDDIDSSIVVSEDSANSTAYAKGVNVTAAKSNVKEGSFEDSSMYVTGKDSSEGGYGSGASLPLSKMKEQTSEEPPSNLKDPTLEDDLAKETRTQSLLAWTLGRDVMVEVYDDLRSKKGKFAPVASDLSPSIFIWNDQRIFYKQYINTKYKNILEYINKETFYKKTLDLAKIINTVWPYEGSWRKSAATVRKEHDQEIDSLRAYFATVPSRSSGIDEFIKQQDASLDGILASREQKIKYYNDRKKALNLELKGINEKLDKLRQDYNRANDDIATSDITTERAGEGIDYNDKLYKGRKLDNSKNPQASGFSDTKKYNVEVKQAAANLQQQIKGTIANLEQRAKAIKIELGDIKDQLNNVHGNSAKEYSNADLYLKKQLNELIKGLLDTSNGAIEKMQSYADNHPAIGLAHKAVSCVRTYAANKANEALHKILNLGEGMYYAENASKIQNIHKEFIDKITNIKLENLGEGCNVLAPFSSVLSASVINNAMQPVYDIFKDLCKDGYCTAADNQYYLSYLGRKRDFKAPKGALAIASAPLREVFHFDMLDYRNLDFHTVGKMDDNDFYYNNNITLSAPNFLATLDVPDIWKHILARRSFVERSMDLADIFGKASDYTKVNSANREYLRSGVYPCILNNKYVDVIKGKYSSTYQYKDSVVGNFRSIGQCQEVASSGGKIVDRKIGGTPYYKAYKDNDKFNETPVSELATVLGYVPDDPDDDDDFAYPYLDTYRKLTFNEALQNAFLVQTTAKELKKNTPEGALFYMSFRSVLDRNQFGDYLQQHEALTKAQKMIQELEIHLQEIRESILLAMDNAGYALREDFDLTNQSDYDEIGKVLLDQKKAYMRSVQNGLQGIHPTTDNLQGKVKKVNHTLDVLNKDAQTVVAVTGEEDIDELEERIRNKQADSSLTDEYTTEADKTKVTDLMYPYCAVY